MTKFTLDDIISNACRILAEDMPLTVLAIAKNKYFITILKDRHDDEQHLIMIDFTQSIPNNTHEYMWLSKQLYMEYCDWNED